MTRYKSLAENAEKVEDELKAEKRKLQREAGGGSFLCSRLVVAALADALLLFPPNSCDQRWIRSKSWSPATAT